MENITIENTRLIFRNFAGAAGKYNRSGDRNFSAVIKDPDEAQRLIELGWPVRARTPKGEDEDPFYYIPVKVKFGARPPRAFMVVNHKKTLLTEDTIGALDYAEIVSADISIRPYRWEMDGRSGVSAYLKTLYAVVEGDEFEDKYAYDDDGDGPDDELPWA